NGKDIRAVDRIMSTPNGRHAVIDKRDFDAHRPLLLRDADGDADSDGQSGAVEGRQQRFGEADRHSLLSDGVSEILARDRTMVSREAARIGSFAWGVLSWYVASSFSLTLSSSMAVCLVPQC